MVTMSKDIPVDAHERASSLLLNIECAESSFQVSVLALKSEEKLGGIRKIVVDTHATSGKLTTHKQKSKGRIMKSKKLVCGVGINDADYKLSEWEVITDVHGNKRFRRIWSCPFYRKWYGVLERGFSSKLKEKHPTYALCSVVEEWKTFSNFKAWMEKQDWEGKEIDKDLLVRGNKEYGPNTCVFISDTLNLFITERENDRGEWPIGVSWRRDWNKFIATCRNPFSKNKEYLGHFTCPNEAHQAWLKKKREHALALAAIQTDKRISQALLDRYESEEYSKHFSNKAEI